ncbi:hypothetical protein [Pseudomonas aeruginosa]|uniref:hypothetical protein n=1 Tax=Pseudomonas aeruginosa TaxID=287 RepID=UPI0021F10A01|nr:hypothetical protein [Pseudomonas aeruginosa]MCV6328695.1 hypothetical protein [Pseudomonas aeruginosa]
MKTSNRVVIEVDPAQKQQIYAALKARGLTMREWFLQQVSELLSNLVYDHQAAFLSD